MNLKHLLYITTIAEERSISEAARKLFVEQSSLSHCLKKNEEEIGMPLFLRTTPLTLTYAGEIYLQTARKILSLERELYKQMEDIRNDHRGRIIIGLLPRIGNITLPYIWPQYQAQHPLIDICLVEENRAQLDNMLERGLIDLTFTTSFNHNPNFTYELIFEEDLLMLTPQKYLEQNPPNPSVSDSRDFDVGFYSKTPFILLKPAHKLRRLVNNFFKDHDFEPNVILETDSPTLCADLVMQGLGVTIIPSTTVARIADINAHTCIQRLGSQYRRALGIAYKKNAYMPQYMQDFISVSKEVIASKYPPGFYSE